MKSFVDAMWLLLPILSLNTTFHLRTDVKAMLSGGSGRPLPTEAVLKLALDCVQWAAKPFVPKRFAVPVGNRNQTWAENYSDRQRCPKRLEF
jgi:hypothetical protein